MIMTNVWVLDHKKKVIKIDHELNVFGITIKKINDTLTCATVMVIKQDNIGAFTQFIITTTIQPHIAGRFL